MGIDESEVSRLFAGEVPIDDPQLGKVSAFLSSLDAACPPSDVAPFEAHHLAVVAREVRLVGAARQRDRQGAVSVRLRSRVRRAVAATSAGLLVLLTAGVGVASAMGVNPLQLVPGLVIPWLAPDAPARTSHPTGGPANGQQDSEGPQTPVVFPTVSGQPTAEPTSPPTRGRKDTARSNQGNDGNNGKSNSGTGNSGNGNSGNGKGNSGDPNPGKGKDDAGHRPSTAPTR